MAVRRSGSILCVALAAIHSVGVMAAAAEGPSDRATSAVSRDRGMPTSPWAGFLASPMPPAPPAEVAPRASSVHVVGALPRWTGGVNLYDAGVFSTQRTWIWCTAAGVQIMRNIVHDQSDQSRSRQQRYFRYMRAHQRYPLPLADGVDPTGWAAGLRRWVDPRYRVIGSGGFTSALRSAVKSLRATNLPVGLAVAHGNHAWVLTGFTATADPAVTSRFRITSVRVVGPLWGLQSRRYGYDMSPNTRLTRAQLRRFFTDWHYAGIPMTWEGRWVTVQAVDRD
jgi:hypothetical protein